LIILCCAIEEEMEKGTDFDSALTQSFARFREDEFRQIQQQTIYLIHHKKRIMKIIAISALSLLLYFPTAQWVQEQEPPSLHPLGAEYKMTSGFGIKKHPFSQGKLLHKGIDFKAPTGTPVKAGGNGIVKKIKRQNEGYGYYIIIDHGEGYESLYAQLSAILVEEGQEVTKGDVIGKVGSSGAATGPHLHYEVRKDDKAIDPASFL
jgi:murein DD-endopeptidase MepM/ murein hydrolase activator NlpD